MAISTLVAKTSCIMNISRIIFATRSLLIRSFQKTLLLARLFVSSNIIDATTSTLGGVLESGRSIGKCLSNSASNVANDTSDSVYSA
jgi:hypothetical protein